MLNLSVLRRIPAYLVSVSQPFSSNRTCGTTASGSPTGFIVRHIAGLLEAFLPDAAVDAFRR